MRLPELPPSREFTLAEENEAYREYRERHADKYREPEWPRRKSK